MKTLIPLILAGALLAACGQSEPAATSAAAPATTATTESRPAPASAPTAAANPAPAATAANAEAAPAGETAPILLAQASSNALADAGFVEGRHYVRLSPAQPTSTSPGQVEVAEFFMYSCIHCYNLEPYVQAWLPNKPAHINFVHVPTTWDGLRRLHAQAYYAAMTLGKLEEIHLPLFREMHDNKNALESTAKMRDFFGRFGVSGADFDSVFNSFSVVTQVNRAAELGERYRINSTPTIIVNGKYRTGVTEAGGTPERLFALIEALAAAELGR